MVSLANSATEVFVGSSTQGLGGLIMSGSGGGPSAIAVGGGSSEVVVGNANATGIMSFTGGAERGWKQLENAVGSVIGLMAVAILL